MDTNFNPKMSSEPLEEKPFLTENDFIARFDKFRHGIFKSSLDHWIETGKLSGSFLLEVRSLIKHNSSEELDDWKQVIIMHKDAIYELESQVSSLESDLKALREERDKFAIEFNGVIEDLKAAKQNAIEKQECAMQEEFNAGKEQAFIDALHRIEQFKAYTLNTEKN